MFGVEFDLHLVLYYYNWYDNWEVFLVHLKLKTMFYFLICDHYHLSRNDLNIIKLRPTNICSVNNILQMNLNALSKSLFLNNDTPDWNLASLFTCLNVDLGPCVE